MNKIRALATLAILASLILGCTPTPAQPAPSAMSSASVPSAYLGQTLPGLTPQVFAPGIVSIVDAVDYAGTFSPDGKEFYFTRRMVDSNNQNIYETHWANGAWTTPAPVSFSAGYNAHEPHVTLDNKTLYFGWFRPMPPGEMNREDYGIWATDRTASDWSDPHYVGEGMFVSSDKSGQIYLTNLTTRSVGKATLTGGRFTNWDHIARGAHPAIAPGGSYLIYDDGDGYLRVEFRLKDGTWSPAKSLTTQGIPASASIASISPDGKYLFYRYDQDIYWVSIELIQNLNANNASPTTVASGINSQLSTYAFPDSIDPARKYLFYLHGKIIEDQGIPAISPDYGEYEYEAILEKLASYGFIVISEQRPKNADRTKYAERVVRQLTELLNAGVPAKNITVIGASKGAGIAMVIFYLLKNQEVNFVVMGTCDPDTVASLKQNDMFLYGNVLAIRDSVDELSGSCQELFAFSEGKGLARREEIVLHIGTGHGILYKALDEWIVPAVEWTR
jgi:hypothetical protein